MIEAITALVVAGIVILIVAIKFKGSDNGCNQDCSQGRRCDCE
jgi:hypothetical protein